MIATSGPPDPNALLARQLLALSAELDAAEERIKRAIIAAAEAGDCPRVITIVTRWLTLPTLDVLPAKGAAHGS